MKQDLLAHTKDVFNAFRVESIWLRTVFNISDTLYSPDTKAETILKRTAPQFFADLNHILIEYWVLLVCRLTDPPRTGRRENLTAQTLIEYLGKLGLLSATIEAEAMALQQYRDLLSTARNRVVSHADKETFLNPALLGTHSATQVTAFLEHLQVFNDIVGEVLGEGPLDFRSTSGPGDALDLLRFLNNAT